MSSDGKFFTKVKNAFKSDKKDTESSPNSSSKTSAPSASASKSHQKVIDEAYSEGRKFFHLKHSSSKGNIGSSSGSASGSGSSVEQGGKHSKDQHHDILRQAYKEGQKLFHYHAKHGVSSSTSQKQGTSPSTYAGAGVGAAAGAGAGAVGASTGSGSPKTPSTPRENKSTTSSVASGLSHDREVIAESSIGRVVTSPPRRSREPLEHTIPGDFANEKRPTDSTVVVGGGAAAAGSGNAASGAQSTNASVDAPRYTDGAETVKGSGKYFDPKDTQGGVLGATKTDKDADAYNERTKAEYHDLSNLKTKPSYPEGTVEKGGDLETVKNLAYEEGGVSAVFEENTTGPQATKSNAKSGSSGNTAAGVASGAAAGAGLAGVAASSGNAKQSSNDKSSSKGVYDISDAQGKDIPRNEIDHSSYKNTSSGLGSENLAADPSNASTYAVHDEPIAAPELKDIDDGHNQVSYTDTRNATTATKVDNSSPEGVNSGGSAGIAAGATSALGAAAAYLGLSKGNKDTEPSDTAYSGAFKENQTSTLSENAPTREVPASSYNEGQLKGLKDEFNSDGKGDNVNRSLDPSSTSSSGSSRPENSKEQAEAIAAAAAGGFGAVGYGSSTSKGANATTGNANLASESGKTGYHDGSKNDLSKEAYQAGKAKANAEKNATASHVPRTEAYEAGKDKAKTDKNAIAGAVPTGEAYQAGKAKGYNEKDSSTSAVPRAEAYQAGKTQGYEDKDISASTVPREQAYQAGKNKAETERDSSTLKQSGDTSASTDSETSSPSKGYLAAAGAAIGGAVGYAFGGKGSKENDVDDSLIEDAEKVDPTISKLPQHKVDDKELKKETTLSRDATFDEKELVASNDRKIWEKDVEDYNKQHGFVGNKESLIQEAEDKDPSISKLPAHKVYKDQLRKDTTLGRDATFDEKELVAANDRKIWEKDAADYDKKHGFSSNSHKSSYTVDAPKLNALNDDEEYEDSNHEKGYLAAAGAAIGGAVGYAFGGKGSSKENEVDDSLIEDAEKVDPAISKLPPHKVDKDQLKKETTLSHDATFDDKELVASNDRKIWEKETDDYNKKHGFTNQTDSLIQEAAEVDPSITQLPAHKLKNQEGKEMKPKVAEANPEEVDTSAIQNFRKLEDDVSTYNKKHGHIGPQESLLAVAEEADPKISKLPTHKGEVQKLPANHPTARHREVSAGAGAGLAAGSSAHSHAAEQEPTHKSQLDPEFKKDLYSQGYTKGRSSHSSGPSSTAAGTGAGLAAGSSAHSHFAEQEPTHKSQLDSDLKKDLYSQGYTKGKSSHSSVPSSASDSHNHHRTVSGTSYNATKPINEGELPEPDLQDDVSGHDSRKSGAGIGAAALAGGAIGGGAAALATSDKHLDNNLKSELYEAGRSKGLAGSSQTEHADSTLDPKLQTTAYDAGQAKGLNTTGSTNSGLHPTLKEQLYNEGYTSATTGHPYLGKQDAKQDVGATREISSLDPAQNHKSYEPSHNQGYSDSAVQGNYSTANPSKSEVLDSKLKQDIYEHGYAKGSTEAKQEKQKASPYGHPTGSSNREAAVVGGAGLAGLAAGAAGTFGHHKESPKYQQQDKNIESVEEVSAAESRTSNKDDLVVEVIGIEDREEALNTAKKASKKLDAKGVDLTTGKLVINANTKEIYKAEEPEGLTNQSASKDIPSSGLSQNTSVGSRAPSSQPAADSTHSSSPSSISGKVDTYQQTEAAKKRLAEAARKNVTSTQKHSNSGLTGSEATALGAGVAGTAGIASVAGHNSHKSTDVNHIPSHATVSKEIDPPNTHKHGYEGDGGISSQPPVKKQDTETSTSDDEIFVNVKGTKDNVLATKIARTAVARLQKTHASVVAKVKELQVDATSGIVRNENGQEIAQYPDLAVEKNKSGTESVGQGAKSLESPKHKDAISHGHSSKDHIKDRDTHSTGAAVTGGVAGTAAAAAAAAATAHGKSRNEPTASTHGQSSSRAISDAGTGHQDEKNVANTPQHHYGNQNVGSNSYSPDTYGSAIGTSGVQEKTAPAVTGIHSKGIGAAAYPESTNAGNTGLAKDTAPASTSATYGESPSADYSKSGATGAVPATYLNTSGAPTGSLNTAGVVGGAGFGDNSNTSSYHQTGREREYEAPSLQSESGLHTTQANKGSPLGGLASGETNIRGTNFASKDSNYSLSGSGAQSQHGQAVGNSEIPKSIGTTNVGNTNRYSVNNKNLSGRSTTGAGAGNTIAGDADDADSSFFSVAETSTYSMPGSWNKSSIAVKLVL
ncbi:hypothetical protein FOB64_005638 [Candida albicans]|uniref:Uncharacterized protein n=1 Tax=Candida albicans TaxID=5476 RepID=A0A8H6F026_CANAX|nr:hypothetical protein FOB64_005638 [Candida albicans]